MNHIPLAERMRPNTLDEYVGQAHLVGSDTMFRKAVDRGVIPSIILWGPPGVGKTTLARILSTTLNRSFYTLSAINSGVKDIREIINKVESQGLFGQRNAILFIDEIHRFSKSQQDSLLGAVEKGVLTLVGATTENPSFEVNSALLSRCQVHVLKPLEKSELQLLINRAIHEDDHLKVDKIKIEEDDYLIGLSGGDARKLLNILESVIQALPSEDRVVTNEIVKEVIQNNPTIYDKDGDQHYDIVSAFIKSIRGSDPNGAVYWLARMIAGGEDPKFIARRLIISASEDIGIANPTALVIANNTFDTINKVGMPEGRIVLSQCAIYLASSPKSNAAYEAINLAMSKVKESGNLQVPLHLRNAPTKLMKEMGYGEDYLYSHSFENNFKLQEYLPDEIRGLRFYSPGENAREFEIRKHLNMLWQGKYGY